MASNRATNAPFRGAEQRRELRRYFRGRRAGLSAAEQAEHARAATRHFFAGAATLSAHTIGAYLAYDGELDTTVLLERLLQSRRRRLALPVVGPAGRMDFYRLRRNTALLPNRFGIAEPAPGAAWVAPLSIDLLLVPLVAFDDFGVRLGMGAGYYDRFVGRLPRTLRPRLVGLAHDVQRSRDPLPFDTWDVPLDAVITESGWRHFDPAPA